MNISIMEDAIQQAKTELIRTVERMERALSSTPDDRINWSPSPSCRTPLQLAAHSAIAIAGIHRMLLEQPRLVGEFGDFDAIAEEDNGEAGFMAYPFATVAEMDAAFRAAERNFSTREEVLDLLDQTTTNFMEWMDTLTLEQFEAIPDTFMGPVPVSFGITIPALHMNVHIAQIDYIQTIYGDLDWHVMMR